ncbi:hypothetical protein [Chryseobacterium phocaeense]|uniref:hypothetical protein n=1 Tax=Chryseobacterium phocaeense TaxID=1816690 RepID=UPI0009B99E43|nr:hypothetical protein [Chryseobacterium phocaeense]
MGTQNSEGAQPANAAEEAVVFINKEVLSPPAASPMTGAGKVMIDQSTGMMVQDLQSFLKGFEQVGLIALSRLANNFLTYGTPSENKPPPKKKLTEGAAEETGSDTGNEMMRDLFKMVSDYAEVKTKISTAIYAINSNLNPPAAAMPVQDLPKEDAEKKNN